MGEKSLFTSFEDFDGGNVTFNDESIAHVIGRASVSILGCLDLNEVLFVNGLRANLISIIQIYDSDSSVKFSQNVCKVFNKEREITLTRHKIMDNCYTINSSSKTSQVCSSTKLDVTELWHRRLGHINYKDLAHITNNDLVRGIPKLSGQLNATCGECMKSRQVRE